MTFHGDCVGPIGSHLYHGSCPHTWTSSTTGRVMTCGCTCHEES
jgi:hypothetical protein